MKDNFPTYPARPHNGGPFKRDANGRDNLSYNPEDYSFTPKYNGWRVLIHVPTRKTFNRYGEPLSIGKEFSTALGDICSALDAEAFKWLDVEGLERRHSIGKGALILLDVIPTDDYNGARYEERGFWVTPSIIPVHQLHTKPEANGVYQAQRFSAGELSHNWNLMQQINKEWGCEFYEGVVAARRDAPYPIQLRSPDQTTTSRIKHRWKF